MQMLIGGKHVDAKSKRTFDNVNPFNGEIVCTVPSGNSEDFEEAARIAKAAQPVWAGTPFYKRADIIRDL